jgi:hypothetical protein
MLTRSRFKLGKGKLASYKSEIQRRFRKREMVSKGKEGEDPPMRPEEVMATLRSMREIIDDLYRRVHKTGTKNLR